MEDFLFFLWIKPTNRFVLIGWYFVWFVIMVLFAVFSWVFMVVDTTAEKFIKKD